MPKSRLNISKYIIAIVFAISTIFYGCTPDETPKPDGTFTFEITQEYSPVNVDFNASINYGKDYYWDFGDGTTGTGITITHKYQDKGTYEVTLISEGLGGTTTKTSAIEIPDRPSSVKIDKITLTKWPLLNNGEYWDQGLLGTNINPDIWYTIDIDNSGVFHDAPFPINDVADDKEAAWISKENNDTILVSFGKESTIYFYDYELTPPHQLILKSAFNLSDFLDYPEAKNFIVTDSTDAIIATYELKMTFIK